MSEKKLKFIDGNMIEYEILSLVDRYDPILRQTLEPVDFETTPGVKISYAFMSLLETLNHHRGAGLAANQVGLTYRMCAVSNDDNKIWGLINPVILEKSKNIIYMQEGCLSFPGLFLTIGRADSIVVEFCAVGGEKKVQRFNGLPAIIAQHEIDHLNGVVFTDLVSELKLERAKKEAKKMVRKLKRQLAHLSS